MLMFSADEIDAIRKKAKTTPEFILHIEKQCANIYKKIYIQETAKATWVHYFLCPKHTVPLEYDYMNPFEYKCPIDGEVFTGEPYEGAWWMTTLDYNTKVAMEFAAAYIATEDNKYLDIVHTILLGYAKYYPTYEEHGDIPYNHPGKATSQVLNEADIGRAFLKAYDMTKDTFTKDEQEFIEKNLFLEIGYHIKKHLVDQIHNHEVANCSTLASIGIYLGIDEFIQRGLNGKYGIKYQLDNAILDDGFWFEGTVGYHQYTLRWVFEFEKIARHTQYSLLKDIHYRELLFKMLTFTNILIKKDHSIPLLNDGAQGTELKYNIYEYAYSEFKDEEILINLYDCIDKLPRYNVESLLFGTEELPKRPTLKFNNYFTDIGSRLAVIHGSSDRHFLFKALPYGGEHDHYDRLAISFSAYGKDICADLGTAHGYGAPLHYAYFKNTATHNTVVINGDNMPPRDCKVNEYRQNAPDDIYMDVSVDWISKFKMPDSIYIKAWSDESYAGTKMRRIVQWYDKYFIDIFEVDSPNELNKDWTWHIDGERTSIHSDAIKSDSLSHKNPQAILHSIERHYPKGIIKNTFNCNSCMLDIHSLCGNKEFIYAKGPANPSTYDISYIIQRTADQSTIYINVIEAYSSESVIENVEISEENKKVYVKITEKCGKTTEFSKQL